MASRSLPERWPVAGAMGLGALVLLVVTWLVDPALTVGVVVGVLFGDRVPRLRRRVGAPRRRSHGK